MIHSVHLPIYRKEGNALFNGALNILFTVNGMRHMVKDHSNRRDETYCHMGYFFRLAARILLYAPSHRQDSIYHGFCYTSRGAREMAQLVPSHHEQMLLPQSYISLPLPIYDLLRAIPRKPTAYTWTTFKCTIPPPGYLIRNGSTK